MKAKRFWVWLLDTARLAARAVHFPRPEKRKTMTTLIKNSLQRWELDGYELTSGNLIEVKMGNHWNHDYQRYVIHVKGNGVLLITSSLAVRLLQR